MEIASIGCLWREHGPPSVDINVDTLLLEGWKIARGPCAHAVHSSCECDIRTRRHAQEVSSSQHMLHEPPRFRGLCSRSIGHSMGRTRRGSALMNLWLPLPAV